MDKPKTIHKNSIYVGIFASDPKMAHKTITTSCKNAIHQTLKKLKPQEYLSQLQNYKKQQSYQKIQEYPSERDMQQIQKDFVGFQTFNPPKDNYHITSLFIGKNANNLNKHQKQILERFKAGIKQNIRVQFIAYVPGYLMTAYSPDTGNIQNANQYPHMTLLLKGKASAVQSNSVLETIAKKYPLIMKERKQFVTILNLPYGNISDTIIVVDLKFQLQGVTGDNVICGKR